jgi:hypothetical protein
MSEGSTESVAPQVGDKAPDVVLLDDHGQRLLLSSLWDKRALLLVFVRHFG